MVVYPSYNLGLQPVLGVDLLSFRRGHQRPTVAVGWLAPCFESATRPTAVPTSNCSSVWTGHRCLQMRHMLRCEGFERWIGSEILKIVMDDVVEISVQSVDRDRGQDRTVSFIDFR